MGDAVRQVHIGRQDRQPSLVLDDLHDAMQRMLVAFEIRNAPDCRQHFSAVRLREAARYGQLTGRVAIIDSPAGRANLAPEAPTLRLRPHPSAIAVTRAALRAARCAA